MGQELTQTTAAAAAEEGGIPRRPIIDVLLLLLYCRAEENGMEAGRLRRQKPTCPKKCQALAWLAVSCDDNKQDTTL